MPMAKVREIKEKIGLKLWKLVEEGGEVPEQSSESEDEPESESESSSEDESPKEKKKKVINSFSILIQECVNTDFGLVPLQKF